MRYKLEIINPLNEHPVEGTLTISNSIKKEFNKPIFEKKIKHLIIGGFFDAYKLRHLANDSSIVLHLISNQKFSFFRTLRCLFDDLRIKSEKKRFSHTLINLCSSLIPVFVKRKFIAKFKNIIVPTNYLKTSLKLKNATVIPLGIPVDKFKSKNQGEGVAYFAAPSATKGFKDLCNASLLTKSDIMFYFSLRSEKMKKLLKKYPVTIKGKVKNIVDAYNAHSIIILPFRTNNSSIGVPLVLIEAMACERAIITTNLPHIKEICGDSVIYVDPFSPVQIADAIKLLEKDSKLRKDLGKKARQRIINNYSEKIMLEKLKKYYSSLK